MSRIGLWILALLLALLPARLKGQAVDEIPHLPAQPDSHTLYEFVIPDREKARTNLSVQDRDSILAQAKFSVVRGSDRDTLLDSYLRFDGYSAPKALRQFAVPFTAAFRQSQSAASCRLLVLVQDDGTVSNVYVTNYSHADMASACALGVFQWRFARLGSPRFATIIMRWSLDDLDAGGTVAQSDSDPCDNPALQKELRSRLASDQSALRRYEAGELPLDALETLSNDNEVWLTKLLLENGWPSIKEVGRIGMHAIFVLVQHATLALQERLLPSAKESFQKGDLPGDAYALLHDRIQVRNGKPQLYGTQARPRAEWANGVPVLYDIEDSESVDIRRAALGMTPLKDYLVQLGSGY